jgi:hypothetical protein
LVFELPEFAAYFAALVLWRDCPLFSLLNIKYL